MRIGVNGCGLRESPDDGGTDALHGILAPYAVGQRVLFGAMFAILHNFLP